MYREEAKQLSFKNNVYYFHAQLKIFMNSVTRLLISMTEKITWIRYITSHGKEHKAIKHKTQGQWRQ